MQWTHLPHEQAAVHVRLPDRQSHPECSPPSLEGGLEGRVTQEEIQDEGAANEAVCL
jgi:hypothetical protein